MVLFRILKILLITFLSTLSHQLVSSDLGRIKHDNSIISIIHFLSCSFQKVGKDFVYRRRCNLQLETHLFLVVSPEQKYDHFL